MKKLLPLLRNLLTRKSTLVSAALLLFVMVGMVGKSHAQVHYISIENVSETKGVNDAIRRMDYSGANITTIASNIGYVPSLIALDLAGNRVFYYEGINNPSVAQDRSLKVINATSGALIKSIPIPYTVNDLKYDAATGYIYFVTTNGGITLGVEDAIYKVNPTTDNTVTLLASSLSTSMTRLALDVPNNRIFIWETVPANRGIKIFNLTSNTITNSITPQAGTVSTMEYDAVADIIYYMTNDGSATNLGVTDALNKINPDGSNSVVIKSSISTSPASMGLDAGNNRAYFYEGLAASKAIKTVDLTTGAVVQIVDLTSTPSGVQIQSFAVPQRATLSTSVGTTTASSANLGGNITRSDVGVTERGVLYSTSNNTPTVGGSNVTKATNGTGTGVFSANIAGLSGSTTYYVRAYAISAAGTAYGAVSSFTTPSNDATLSAITISAGTLNPGFNSGVISYTATVANANSTVIITPTKNNAGASIQVNNIAAASGSGSSINLTIGDNAIPVKVTAADGSTTKTYTITFTRPKAAQTIAFANTATKTFGDADFAPGASASSGLGVSYSSDNPGVATIVSGQIHIVGAGTANITASQGGDGNTLPASNVVQVLTVNKASQTITFNALPAKTYGSADFAPGATATSGLNVTYSSDNTAVATIVNNQIHIVGQGIATITAVQAGNNNYNAANIATQTVSVGKATVTVTANAQTKKYGDNDPAFTYTATGVVGTDAPTGALSRVSPYAYANKFVGTYAIGLGTLSYGSNYNINYTGANLTITKRPITLAPLPVTKTYGDRDFESGAPYQITGAGLVPGDGMTGTFGRTPESENVGTYALNLGGKHPVDASNGEDGSGNYDISFITNTFTITPKPVTVTASAQTKTYGDNDPALTYTNDGLAFDDSFTGELTRATGNDVGTYAISRGTLALNSNYTVTFNGNNLTIGTKNINVTANAQTKTYGTADPALTYTNDALSFGDVFIGSLTRDAGEEVGDHAITQGSLALSSNYTLSYTGANLSIGKATLTYVATPATRPAQTANPTFDGSVTGFVNGDTQGTATSGTLSFTSTASLSSPLGNYPIVGSGLSAANYDFVQDASNSTALTVTASTDATLANLTVAPGTLNPVFSSEGTSYGFGVANNVASFNLTATANQADASIVVNGVAVTSGSTKSITLYTGTNNINVIVTAQDGSTSKQYTLNVFRAYDTNNLLASLNLSGVTYSPAFNANTLNYTATVGNLVASTNVTATAVAPTTRILVGGYDLETTNPVTAQLNVGETEIGIVAKAENGDDRVYRVLVTRAQSSDATLASFGNTTIDLNTPFDSSTHTYSTSVAAGVGSLTFKPTATNNRATVQVAGRNVDTYAGNTVNLGFGNNKIDFDVTSEDGTNHGTYALNVYRLRSSEARLSSLLFPFITSLNEQFSADVYSYTADVADSTYTGIPLTAISADENAIVKIDGTFVPRFQNYTLPVHGGANTYHVVVTSQDTSATKTYTLVLTRAGTPPPAQSPVATLDALNVSATGFSKNFNFSFGDNLTTVNVPNSITAVRVFAVSANTVSTVTVNGVVLPYDTNTELLPISLGDNVFTVVVTSEDGAHTKTYDLHVNRLPFADVTLASLNINYGTLSPVFVPGTKTYTVTVPNTVTTMDVTPVANNGASTITIGATQITPSNPTATVNLPSVGSTLNNIRVVVTAADGVNKQTYTISVTRAKSAVAGVSLALSSSAKLTQAPANGADVNFTSSVANSVSSITVTPTPVQANATITVNGMWVAAGTPSEPIALNVGENIIDVLSTAQNGTTTRSYRITVTRAGSKNAGLSLVLNPYAKLTQVPANGANVNFTASVPNAVSTITVTSTPVEPNTTIKVNGIAVAAGVQSQPIALNAGINIIDVLGTAQNGINTRSYRIVVTRAPSNDAGLSLALSPDAKLTVAPAGGADVNFTAIVANSVSSVTVTPTPNQANSTVTVNGIAVTPGTASQPIAVDLGENVINVVGTAPNGTTTRSYRITVTRTPPGSNDPGMALVLTPYAKLIQAPANGADVNFTATVANSVSSISVIPTPSQANATVTVNGTSITPGTASGAIALAEGANNVDVVGTAQDGHTTRSYRITVTRILPGSNAAGLSVSLSPYYKLTQVAANGADVNFTATVPNSQTTISAMATPSDANASIKINGVAVTSGTPSEAIALNEGANNIDVVGTAQDGYTTRSYRITVTRTAIPLFMVNKDDSKLLFANKAVNPVISDNDGVVVHQGVSPNGDGSNDILTIEGISNYSGNKLSIMNTNGTLVFETIDYGKDGSHIFDGHSNKNGALLKPGTYFYSLEYKAGKEKRKTGYIVLKY